MTKWFRKIGLCWLDANIPWKCQKIRKIANALATHARHFLKHKIFKYLKDQQMTASFEITNKLNDSFSLEMSYISHADAHRNLPWSTYCYFQFLTMVYWSQVTHGTTVCNHTQDDTKKISIYKLPIPYTKDYTRLFNYYSDASKAIQRAVPKTQKKISKTKVYWPLSLTSSPAGEWLAII